MLADVTQGGWHGFTFVLKEWKPYYFACSQHDGIHCTLGQMKFFVMPMLHWFRRLLDKVTPKTYYYLLSFFSLLLNIEYGDDSE
jgi:hypothetical protein